ncbi:PREDICTED: prostate and testis expressed protein 4 [Galeopterus variegatus]|uniref:Prostate and testis expressed protein 4 n=1 Tax=Galeopterus variegatus TaxID=482537 RepID=A0ABM0RMV5_GALVR|nr:PREDICTED: prostate and testis expressed protein 4 [Galeopterus variegatus]
MTTVFLSSGCDATSKLYKAGYWLSSPIPHSAGIEYTFRHPNKHPREKMNILLLMSLSLLYLKEVLVLQCNVCIYSNGWKCMAGKGICIAKDNESCSTIYYYRGEKPLYSQHMCKRKCQEETSTKADLMRATLCCNKHLCNIF